jgi:predicted Fe-Mo cluster-binding NifX family protein
MIYLIAAEGPGLDSKISLRFGMAPYHLIVDSESKKILASRGQREECTGFEKYKPHNLNGAITGNIGPKMFSKSQNHGLDVFIVKSKNVSEAIDEVLAGHIQPLSESTLKHSLRDESMCVSTIRHRHDKGDGSGKLRHQHGKKGTNP